MEGKNLKKIILFAIVSLSLFAIIIVILLIFLLKQDDKKIEKITEEKYQELFNDEEEYTEKEDEFLINESEYIAVKECIKRYIEKIDINNSNYYGRNENDEWVKIVTDEEISANVYDVLSTEYIQKNNIQKENALNYTEKDDKVNLLSIIEIKKINQSENVKKYAVNYILQETAQMTNSKAYFIIVNLDENNLTYSVEPVKVKDINEIKSETEIEEIAINDNNTFIYRTLKDEDIIREYINRYKRISTAYPKYAYENIINKEYRESRFGNYEKFNQYIINNIANISSIDIKKYEKTENTEYTQYLCIDQNGKYYIIREKTIMDFELILDTYTIDLPEFIEKYDSAKDKDKVALNVNKIVEAINNKDYEYVYNKLDETYRQNKFGNVENLEKYIKNKFYENNILKTANGKQEGNAYICNTQITNEDETGAIKQNTIIMKLLENRDFVISFAE